MIKIGVIIGSKNTDGSILISKDYGNIETIIPGTKLFIGFSQKFSSIYSLEQINEMDKGYLLKVSEINSPEDVKSLKEQAVFIDEERIIKKNQNHIDDLLDYEIYDVKTKGILGYVIEVLKLPANDVLIINSNNNEVLIPFTDNIIYEINHDEKKIFINVIDGLIE